MEDYLRVAICEDNKVDYHLEKALIERSECKVPITHYPDGKSFLDDFLRAKFDLILMDIYMPEMDGIEVVRQIRLLDEEVPIAFLTASEEHALDGYRYHVGRYLTKPVQKAQMEEVLLYAEERKRNQPAITIMVNRQPVRIPLQQIIYIEQMSHKSIFHLENHEDVSIFSTLSSVINMLPSPPFISCHQSYCANLTKVVELNEEFRTLTMSDHSMVYVRRQDYSKVKKMWMSLHPEAK